MRGTHRILPFALLAGAAAAQCKHCAQSGSVECKKHGKDLELELFVLECSEAEACRSCRGALELVCKRCKSENAGERIATRVERARAWREKLREKIDPHVSRTGVMHLKTAHVDLTFSIKPMTVGRKKLDTHRLMHVYGERVEAVRKLLVETFELGPNDVPARLQIYMFHDAGDHNAIAPRVTGGRGAGASGTKWMGDDSIYCMYRDKSLRNDETLHRNVVHNVAHLLLSNMLPQAWVGNLRCGWIDAGVAHWFEWTIGARVSTYCFEEVWSLPNTTFKSGRFKVAVRQLVATDKLVPFAKIFQKNTDQLDLAEHAQAFAYVDFLISEHGGKALADLVRAIKNDRPMREALQTVYGLNPLSFDEKFRAWVEQRYPLK